MNLVGEDLDMLGPSEGSLELLDLLGILVLRCQHNQRDFDLFGILGIDHGRVDFGSDLEGALAGREGQRDDLGPPAEAEHTPLLDVGILLLDCLDGGVGLGHEAGGAVLPEEGANLLLLVVVVGREQADVQRRTVEGIGHEDGVLVVVVGRGQDVAALEGLVKEAEDVHDDEDGLGGLVGRAGNVRLPAIKGVKVSLLLVARRDDGRDVAAGLGVAAGGFHGRHSGR